MFKTMSIHVTATGRNRVLLLLWVRQIELRAQMKVKTINLKYTETIPSLLTRLLCVG